MVDSLDCEFDTRIYLLKEPANVLRSLRRTTILVRHIRADEYDFVATADSMV
jgi:hypothetical protein